ncbi:hypothetical protein ACHWQZ_G001321 [Mnemiopsis leidyi]
MRRGPDPRQPEMTPQTPRTNGTNKNEQFPESPRNVPKPTDLGLHRPNKRPGKFRRSWIVQNVHSGPAPKPPQALRQASRPPEPNLGRTNGMNKNEQFPESPRNVPKPTDSGLHRSNKCPCKPWRPRAVQNTHSGLAPKPPQSFLQASRFPEPNLGRSGPLHIVPSSHSKPSKVTGTQS